MMKSCWFLPSLESFKKTRDANITISFVRMTRKEKTQRKEICSISRYESVKQNEFDIFPNLEWIGNLTLTLTLTLNPNLEKRFD